MLALEIFRNKCAMHFFGRLVDAGKRGTGTHRNCFETGGFSSDVTRRDACHGPSVKQRRLTAGNHEQVALSEFRHQTRHLKFRTVFASHGHAITAGILGVVKRLVRTRE